MKTLKRWCRNNPVWLVLACIRFGTLAWAGSAQGGPYTLTKDLWGASGGTAMTGGNASMMGSAGESLSGLTLSNNFDVLHSGYLGGFTGVAGPLKLVSFKIGSTTSYFEDGVQVGVPLNAPVELVFTGQVLPGSLSSGIQASIVLDHLSRSVNLPEPITYSYSIIGTTVTVRPQQSWQGNSFYDLQITPYLQDIDGFTFLGSSHVPFVTALNPAQENVVLKPLPTRLVNASFHQSRSISPGSEKLVIEIPSQALSEFSLIRVNSDPMNSPGRIDPEIIQEANRKALASSGGYSAPIALREISGLNLQGQSTNSLSRLATLSVSFSDVHGWVTGGGTPVWSRTLSLWALDEAHALWVRLPSRQTGTQTVTASVGRFSIFALMGGPAGGSAEAYIFPNPWRPHGPNAGTGAGQSGTDQSGMIFSNIPSECRIRIYTLSGTLVRELHHSDLKGPLGQEPWDARNANGSPVASGVYLWRSESATENHNGKLMIIR